MTSSNNKSGSALRILYLGTDDGTSRHRFLALQRCGHAVDHINPYVDVTRSGWLGALSFKSGFMGLDAKIAKFVLSAIGDRNFDVIWVDSGQAISKSLAIALKSKCRFLLAHNLDNPFSKHERMRWRLLLRALPIYDLFVTPRRTSCTSALASGARRSIVVWQASDEIVHQKRDLTAAEEAAFASKVVFAGTWMRERGPFMKRLIDLGVPLRIFGPRWNRAPEYPTLAPIVTGGVQDDYAYVRAISGAKIALCQLSRDNEDVHTTRSLEIPAIGTVLCAPRTSDHEALYRDRVEACFFESADECAELCLKLLANDEWRRSMAVAGHSRAIQNGRFNQNMVEEILAACISGAEQRAQAGNPTANRDDAPMPGSLDDSLAQPSGDPL